MEDFSGTAHIGPQGRVVIPARVRAQLQLREGQELAVWVQDGAVVMQDPKEVVKNMRGMFKNSAGSSVVDELVADRRKNAERERQDRS